MYQDIRDRNTVFESMMCRNAFVMLVGTSSAVEMVNGELVSGNYFNALGVKAALGRVFTASDDLHQGAHPYAVISYAYWKSRFGGDPKAVGQTIRVNNYPLTIVGVSQEGFDGVEPGLPAQIRIPIAMNENLRPGYAGLTYNRRQRFVNVFGRLKPGMTIDRAKAGLQPLFPPDHPDGSGRAGIPQRFALRETGISQDVDGRHARRPGQHAVTAAI